MKNLSMTLLGFLGWLVASSHSMALAGPEIGELAPDFTAMTVTGEVLTLSELRGQNVVLEWTNHDCPYVRKHYGSGNMQRVQRDLTEDGVVWLSVISSGPGEQGHVSAEEAQKLSATRGVYATNTLLDPEGDVGHLYRARTTPHMFLIDKAGILKYKGAIDDQPSTRLESLDGAHNYVRSAWAQLKNGEEIEISSTKPYGCSVHYAR